ncbi:MAG: helix-turn-helix domain-containing protein [Myxococcales bacterium]|nr:MAG: helix-turn-helix domain-containing protein [Myxococcales bacterium]
MNSGSSSRFFSPSQVAQALGVSESSLKRWCDQGLLEYFKTPGGHRRLTLQAVTRYIRQSKLRLARPELLDLPAGLAMDSGLESLAVQLQAALEEGDSRKVHDLLLGAYLQGRGIAELADEVIAPSFRSIGRCWAESKLEVYRERRACEVTLRVLHELLALQPDAAEDAPLAIGASPEGDVYQLPTTLVELVLRDLGWRAQSLGSAHPGATLVAAARDMKPKIFWLSVSYVRDERQLGETCKALESTMKEQNGAFVLGGNALSETMRSSYDYTAHCDKLKHL